MMFYSIPNLLQLLENKEKLITLALDDVAFRQDDRWKDIFNRIRELTRLEHLTLICGLQDKMRHADIFLRNLHNLQGLQIYAADESEEALFEAIITYGKIIDAPLQDTCLYDSYPLVVLHMDPGRIQGPQVRQVCKEHRALKCLIMYQIVEKRRTLLITENQRMLSDAAARSSDGRVRIVMGELPWQCNRPGC